MREFFYFTKGSGSKKLYARGGRLRLFSGYGQRMRTASSVRSQQTEGGWLALPALILTRLWPFTAAQHGYARHQPGAGIE
jgi:hypothetical protein